MDLAVKNRFRVSALRTIATHRKQTFSEPVGKRRVDFVDLSTALQVVRCAAEPEPSPQQKSTRPHVRNQTTDSRRRWLRFASALEFLGCSGKERARQHEFGTYQDSTRRGSNGVRPVFPTARYSRPCGARTRRASSRVRLLRLALPLDLNRHDRRDVFAHAQRLLPAREDLAAVFRHCDGVLELR